MRIEKAETKHISKKGLAPYQFIEKVGRTCYKSEDRITPDSAVKFVQGLVERKHFAMIEHFWVHLIVDGDFLAELEQRGHLDYARFMYCTVVCPEMDSNYITFVSAPLRRFLELQDNVTLMSTSYYPITYKVWSAVAHQFPEVFHAPFDETTGVKVVLDEDLFLQAIKDTVCFAEEDLVPELMKHRTHTFWFKCDRGVSHEIVRHRVASFAQESTRYCNYSKEKFGNEITVIEPLFFEKWYDERQNCLSVKYSLWENSCEYAESHYFALLGEGATPQEARSVLPNSLKTEIIVTANEREWQHIANLRYKGTTGSPHPQMVEVMTPVYHELIQISDGRIV